MHKQSGTGASTDKAATRMACAVRRRSNGIFGHFPPASLFWGDKIMVRSQVTTKVERARVNGGLLSVRNKVKPYYSEVQINIQYIA